MTRDAQLPEPAADLIDTAAAVVRPWLRSLVHRHVGGKAANDVEQLELERVIETVASELLADLEQLLATDVDAQSANPLALFRSSTAAITEWLKQRDVGPKHRDAFSVEAFPDDIYGLYPARWDDIDPALQSTGITWGAWKAMTILQRRRAEGAR